MASAGGYEQLRTAFEGRDELMGAWIEAYRESVTRYPGVIDEPELRSLVGHLFTSVAEAIDTSVAIEGEDPARVELAAGRVELREVEQAAAFLGGNLASSKRSGFDVAALLLSLRDVLIRHVEGRSRAELGAYIEWLGVVAMESFAASRVRAVHESYRELLEEATPLVHIVPELPAIMLIGATDVAVVDSLLSRLLLEVVRVGARAVVVDFSGVEDLTSPWLLERFSRFLCHRKVDKRTVALVVGMRPEAREAWLALGSELRFYDYFDAAIAEGLRLSGYRLVRAATTFQ